MKLIKEEGDNLIVQCTLCKHEYCVDKQECEKNSDGYEIKRKIKCVECGQEDSLIIDYKKMLRIYNVTEKQKNLKTFENEKKQRKIENENNVVSKQILCPNCKSQNVKRISTASKTGSAIVFGIFSIGKLIKTYECRDCKYRW